MIQTEIKRYNLPHYELGGYKPSKDVIQRLKEYDKDLELVWNSTDSQWEFYRIKHKGFAPFEDVLSWQMSAPVKGLPISSGIVDWLKRYDTSQKGKYDKDEMASIWLKQWKERNYIRREKNKKLNIERDGRISEVTKFLIDDPVSYPRFTKQLRPKGKKTIVRIPKRVPIVVGYNQKTGKPIRMG